MDSDTREMVEGAQQLLAEARRLAQLDDGGQSLPPKTAPQNPRLHGRHYHDCGDPLCMDAEYRRRIAVLLGGLLCALVVGCSEMVAPVAPANAPALCGWTIDYGADNAPEVLVAVHRNHLGWVTHEEVDQDNDGQVDAITWYERNADGSIHAIYVDGGQSPPDGLFDWSVRGSACEGGAVNAR